MSSCVEAECLQMRKNSAFPLVYTSVVIPVSHSLHKLGSMRTAVSDGPSGLPASLPALGEMGAPVFSFVLLAAQSLGCSPSVTLVKASAAHKLKTCFDAHLLSLHTTIRF